MKILICGVGSIGKRHLTNLMALGYEDIILYRTGKHTIEDDDLIKKARTVTTMDEALAMKPDVAFICNPTSLHIPTAIKAAQHGCHIFLEKPISDNMNGVDELKVIVDRKKLVTFVGCQFRFHPLLKKIKSLVDSEALGKIMYARAEWSEYLPDWHLWEDYKFSYSARKELGGGVLLTQIHPVDYLYWMFGNVTEVKSLYGTVGNLTLEVEDLAEVLLKFESGIIGSVHVDYIQKPRVHILNIVGKKARIFWDCHHGFMEITDKDGNTERTEDPQEFERNTMFLDEVKHFMDCVQNKKQTIHPIEQGINTLAIILAAKATTL